MRLIKLGLCLCVALMGVAALEGQSSKPKTKPKKEVLKDKLRDLNRKERQAKAELNKVKGQMGGVRQTIDQVDERIDKVEARYQTNEERLAKGRARQKSLAQELAGAQKDYEAKSLMARNRLRLIRMYGQVSFASALVGSKGVSDLASRSLILKKISDHDRDLFEEVKKLRDEIDRDKRDSDVLVAELKTLLADQRVAHAELTAAKKEKQVALYYLQNEASELQKMIRQFDEAEASVESLINANSAGFTGKRPGRLAYPVNARITSGFGARYHPILHYKRMHKGVDFGASHGTVIRSAAAGVVIHAGRMSGYGNVVIVNHGGGLATLYGHCSSIQISSGAKVSQGQPIARVGSTGLSTGPHLHFEVHINGKAVNPRSYL
ncbi:MAG: peptidoglycan DD-metalloendopeptidase family protein [Fimbriimonadaceae bacterium]